MSEEIGARELKRGCNFLLESDGVLAPASLSTEKMEIIPLRNPLPEAR